MEPLLLFDASVELQSRERTPEGYLRATAVLTKVGVMDYFSSELGIPGPSRQVGVMRPHDVVFHETTMASASMKPITLGHPRDSVNVKNHKRHSVGYLGETAFALDSEKLAISILLTDERAIKQVEGGKDDVSVGYEFAGLVDGAGEYNGKQFQHAFDGHMIINHMAIAPRNRAGRGGKEVRILDTDKDKLPTLEDFRAALKEELKAAFPEPKEGEKAPTVSDEQMQALTTSLEKKFEGRFKPPETSADDDPDKDAADEEAVKKRITDESNERAALIVQCQPYLKQDQDAGTMTNREMLLAAVSDTVKEADKKSDEYLRGVLDQETERRAKAKEKRGSNKGAPVKLTDVVPLDAQQVVSTLEGING